MIVPKSICATELHGGPVTRPIQVMGEGDVVRVEPHGPGAGFAIAIKCKREIQLNSLEARELRR